MKKFLALAISSLVFISNSAQAMEKRGTIEKSVNFVQIDQSSPAMKATLGAKRWQKAEVGKDIFVGNSIRTGLRSVAEIKYDDGTMTRIGSRSNVVISDRKLNIKSGYIWGKVDKTRTKGLRIFTANAIASIVGTEFFVEANSDKTTTITVLEGSIEVTGKKGKVFVTEGTSSTIDLDGNPSEPTVFDVNKVVERYSELVKM